MRREIKFRGYDTTNRRWLYGDLTQVKDSKSFFIGNDNIESTQVHSSSVGQYTGLKDKNGVEIYKGDILRYADYLSIACYGEHNTNGTNTANSNSYGWYVKELDKYRKEVGMICCVEGIACAYPKHVNNEYWLQTLAYEVMGNIHDNPELLKGGE